MPLKHLAIGFAIAMAIPAALTSAQAGEDGLYIPLFTYRTGPFSGSGIPYANGLTDYLNMLNERDGGIGGAKLIVEECETGYDTKFRARSHRRPPTTSQILGTPRLHEPRPSLARSGQGAASARTAGSSVRVVH